MLAVVESTTQSPRGCHVRFGVRGPRGGYRRIFVPVGEGFTVHEGDRLYVQVDDQDRAQLVEVLPPEPPPAPPPPEREVPADFHQRLAGGLARREADARERAWATRRDAIARAGVVVLFGGDAGFDVDYGQAPDVVQALATLTGRGAR